MNEYKCFSYPHQHLICIMHNLSIMLHSYIFGSNCKRKHLHSLHHSSSPLLHSFIHSIIFGSNCKRKHLHPICHPLSLTHSFIHSYIFGSNCKRKHLHSLLHLFTLFTPSLLHFWFHIHLNTPSLLLTSPSFIHPLVVPFANKKKGHH